MNAIRNNDKIKGMRIKGKERKILAYADDMVAIIEDPNKSVTYLMQELKEFGRFAGFKINKEKSNLLTKNIEKKEERKLINKTGCKIVKKVKYLGIWLTNNNIHLYENNYKNIWKEIQKDLLKWNKLNLSILGRIASVKMATLPKLLFLFNNLPVMTKETPIKQWEKELKNFIWRGGKPRINWNVLKDSKERGGCALPDLKMYMWACKLGWIQDWIKLENSDLLNLEGEDLKQGWHAYLLYKDQVVSKDFLNHPIRKALMVTWEKVRAIFHNILPLWTSAQEAFNFKKGKGQKWLTYKILTKVEQKGEVKLKDWEVLNREGHKLNWFEYIQIKSRFREDIKKKGIEIVVNDLDLIWWKQGKKKTSKIYKILLGRALEKEIIKVNMIRWAQDIGHPFMYEDWQKAWRRTNKFTASVKALKENHLKMTNRWYLTPVKINKIYTTQDSRCWRCKKK